MRTDSLAMMVGVGLLLHPFAAMSTMAQSTNPPTWQRWLEAAPAVPSFQPPGTLKTWRRQREGIRAELWQLLGKLPPRPKHSTVQTLSREDRGAFVLEKFQFDNGAGDSVPGYLLLPKTAVKKSPAILYCHWHGGHYDVGKEELFRTNATPVSTGPELARRGFVVIAVDACCFGERNGKGPGGPAERGGPGEMTASKFNLWLGRTLWGMMLRDDLMALDYLCTRLEVDAARIGVTGISMGATRTWWLMALDERLKAGVAVCCLTRYQNLIATENLRAHGIYYFVPGFLNHCCSKAVRWTKVHPSLAFVRSKRRHRGSTHCTVRRRSFRVLSTPGSVTSTHLQCGTKLSLGWRSMFKGSEP